MDHLEGYSTYNLGNSEPVKLKDLIDLIMEVLGKKTEIIQKPMQPGDVKHTLADISKDKKELGYDPQISIQNGVQRFVEWYLGN